MFKRLSMAALVVAMVMFSGSAVHAAKPGDAAPEFSLADENGKTVSLADLKGKIVVLEWFNAGCPFVKRAYADQRINTLASTYAEKGVVVLAVNSNGNSTQAANKSSVEKLKVNHPLLDDASGKVGKAYGAKTTPHMFVIDASGKIAYAGALDNDPDGKKGEGRVNYVAKAVDELLAGKTVSDPETKPYGCGVKYAK